MLYLIYKKAGGLNPVLYAFTTKKKLLQSFKEERDMNIFEVKEKDFDKEFTDAFIKKYKGYELGRRGFITKPSSSDSLKKKNHVYITATLEEEKNVYIKSDDIIPQILSRYTDPIACYFNEELLKALNMLCYFDMLKINYTELPFLDGIGLYNKNDLKLETFGGIFNYDWKADMLSVFVHLYGYTMRKDL